MTQSSNKQDGGAKDSGHPDPRHNSDRNKPVIFEVPRHLFRESKKLVYIFLASVLIIAAGGGIKWWLASGRQQNNKTANAAAQANLQKNLALDLSHGDNRSVAYDTSTLINGNLSGKFTYSDKLLAEYYIQAGTASYNLRDYSKAITYYGMAPKYDGSVQVAVLYGEIHAGYAAGERQQLVPLLKQLEAATKNLPHNNSEHSPLWYDATIRSLQQNKQVDL